MRLRTFPFFLLGAAVAFILLFSACMTYESEIEPGATLSITPTTETVVEQTVITRVIDMSVTETPTPIPFPLVSNPVLTPGAEFIAVVIPPENRVIPLEQYTYRSVGVVTISWATLGHDLICLRPIAELLVQEGDVFVDPPDDGERLWDRMELWVDGEIRPFVRNAQGFEYDLPTREPEGPRTVFVEGAYYCWEARLTVGGHEATFRFRQTSGNVKEYTWYFELSE